MLAAGCEDQGLDSGQLGLPGQLDARPEIDIERHFLESVAHRVVRYRCQMHDGIHPLQYFGPKPPHVRKILNVGPALRKDVRIRQAVRKVPLV